MIKYRKVKSQLIRVLIVLLLLTSPGFLVGCTSTQDLDTGRSSDYLPKSTYANSTSQYLSVTYKKDELVEIGGLRLGIAEVKEYKEPNQFLQPADGFRFIAIKPTVENISEEVQSYSILDYKLKDIEGAEWDQGTVDISPGFGSGDLQPGKKATGYIVFEIPKDLSISQLEFEYTPFLSFESQQVIWMLDEPL